MQPTSEQINGWLAEIIIAPIGTPIVFQTDPGFGDGTVQRIRMQLSRLRAQVKREKMVMAIFKLTKVSITRQAEYDEVTLVKEEPISGELLRSLYKEKKPPTAIILSDNKGKGV